MSARGRFTPVLGALMLVIGTGTAVAQPGPAEAVGAPLHWTQTPTGRTNAILDDVDANAGEIWAVGGDLIDDFADQRPLALRWVGGRWQATPQPMRTNSALVSVAVAGADDVWAVGEDRADPLTTKPLVVHWNGRAWRVVPGPTVPAGSFGAVEVGPDGTVCTGGWANVDGTEHAVVYRYAGGKWQPLTAGLEQSVNVNALAVISENDAWLGLNAGLAHFDGTKWELASDVPSDGSHIPTALAVAGPKDIWAVGVEHAETEVPLVLHYDGSSWTRVPAAPGSAQLYGVALHNDRPVVVGERFEQSGDLVVANPLVLEYRGSRFVRAASPTDADGTLTGVDASGRRLWATGLVIAGGISPLAAFAG
jgi:hypothetical protein